jgi:hypothetical protein
VLEVVTVSVLIVVVPDTESVVTPVIVSVVASPNTALPVMVIEFPPPIIVPFVVIVLPVSALLVPKVKLPV